VGDHPQSCGYGNHQISVLLFSLAGYPDKYLYNVDTAQQAGALLGWTCSKGGAAHHEGIV
jgi:hypothetical protein